MPCEHRTPSRRLATLFESQRPGIQRPVRKAPASTRTTPSDSATSSRRLMASGSALASSVGSSAVLTGVMTALMLRRLAGPVFVVAGLGPPHIGDAQRGHGGARGRGGVIVQQMTASPLSLLEFPADDPERAQSFWVGLLGQIGRAS